MVLDYSKFDNLDDDSTEEEKPVKKFDMDCPKLTRRCAFCKGEASRTCRGCGVASFCSSKCQSKAWKGHKKTCKTLDAGPQIKGVVARILAKLADFCEPKDAQALFRAHRELQPFPHQPAINEDRYWLTLATRRMPYFRELALKNPKFDPKKILFLHNNPRVVAEEKGHRVEWHFNEKDQPFNDCKPEDLFLGLNIRMGTDVAGSELLALASEEPYFYAKLSDAFGRRFRMVCRDWVTEREKLQERYKVDVTWEITVFDVKNCTGASLASSITKPITTGFDSCMPDLTDFYAIPADLHMAMTKTSFLKAAPAPRHQITADLEGSSMQIAVHLNQGYRGFAAFHPPYEHKFRSASIDVTLGEVPLATVVNGLTLHCLS